MEIDRYEFDDADYAAKMTNLQFHALRKRLDKNRLFRELKTSEYLKNVSKCSEYDRDIVKGRLLNGWNTEHLLSVTKELLGKDQLIHAIHWAFPQAYYSIYNIILAYFLTAGHKADSHAAVIRKVNELIKSRTYPPSISFLAIGGGKDIHFIGIEKSTESSSLAYNPNEPTSVNTKICQFLKSTRELNLQEFRKRKKDKIGNRFKTKAGKPKMKLSQSDWEEIGKWIGATSILNLLYRKRIKANYMEIDTLLTKQIDAHDLYSCLIHIVSYCNFIHEAFIRSALGKTEFEALTKSVYAQKYPFVSHRMTRLKELFI